MFQGKVSYYENVNGEEKTFEKEFDNYAEYKNFVENKDTSTTPLHVHMPHGSWLGPEHSHSHGFTCCEGQKTSTDTYKGKEEGVHFDSPVDISKYEIEARKIENDKKNLEVKKKKLEETKNSLEGFLEKFKKEKRTDLVKEIEKDIQKVEKELKAL